MNFKNILIIGLGLIGGSLAAALKGKSGGQKLTAIDTGEVVQKARAMNLVSDGYPLDRHPEIDAALCQADLIILATPIQDILNWLDRIADKVKAGVLITDVGSTKEVIVSTAVKRLPGGVYFLGGHPMAGSERHGLENADPLLFKDCAYVLTEDINVPAALVSGMVKLVEGIGARPIFLSSELHDRVTATISHLPQILSTTLMHQVAQFDQRESLYAALAARGFRDMTRLALSPYEIWRDIFRTNEKNIVPAIDSFIEELRSVRNLIVSPHLGNYFGEAAQGRRQLRETNCD
ncbi:MAG TPA: prephenate dehydrogenase/arogenate dehydrogenase family protein [bacterium]